MSAPSDPDPDRPVDLTKGDEPAEKKPEAPFDPYRFGLPDTPPPPEYAPPGWTPPPDAPWGAPASGPYPPSPGPYPPPTTSGYPPPPAGPYSPPPGPYPPPPGRYSPGYPSRGGGKAVAALVLGIGSIVMFWSSIFDAFLIITAVVLGVLALTETPQRPQPRRGQAIAGLVCAGVGAVLAIVFTTYLLHVVNECGGLDHRNAPGFQSCVQSHF